MNRPRYLVVGAGFSGAVLARELAERLEADVEVLDARGHVAGNCHTERDPETEVMVHRYGPHAFHTGSDRVWRYVTSHARFRSFALRVRAVTPRGTFGLPVNRTTINRFFGTNHSAAEAEAFLRSLGDATIGEPRNFEEQALKSVGRELYEAFFRGYTRKQWECDPRDLPASLFRRLPVRFDDDDRYHVSAHQGIPEQGYTALVAAILDHPRVRVTLGREVSPEETEDPRYAHAFWTGPLDAFFGGRAGALGYRTVHWTEERARGDVLGCEVVNYTDAAVPYTRRHEHKHFAPWETHERTIVLTEYSRATGPGDAPYYPVRLAADRERLARYAALARAQTRTTFLGRLGTYRYLDMDQVILDALEVADAFVESVRAGTPAPAFPRSADAGPAA